MTWLNSDSMAFAASLKSGMLTAPVWNMSAVTTLNADEQGQAGNQLEYAGDPGQQCRCGKARLRDHPGGPADIGEFRRARGDEDDRQKDPGGEKQKIGCHDLFRG
jgi:hypothetical protein